VPRRFTKRGSSGGTKEVEYAISAAIEIPETVDGVIFTDVFGLVIIDWCKYYGITVLYYYRSYAYG